MSSEVSKWKSLVAGEGSNVILNVCYEKENVDAILMCGGVEPLVRFLGRGLHSFTFQLNLSRASHIKTPYTPPTPANTPITRATQSHAHPLSHKHRTS